MAIKIYEKFSPRANPADGDYPHGSIKNESVPGAKDGTPLDAVWGNDMVGFTDALLSEAGIVPSGDPDTVVESQRVEAISILSAMICLNSDSGVVKKWKQGEVSSSSDVWIYNGKKWRSNHDGHALESAPTFLTSHLVPSDGELFPEHFGASYIPGVDQTPALQRFEDYQKSRNAPLRLRPVEHTLLTKLSIARAPNIISESGGFGVTTPSPSSSNRRPQGAVFVGKVAGDFSVVISPSTFEFGGQIRGLSVTGKAVSADAKTAGSGVLLNNFGWSAKIDGLSVLDFEGVGLEIGYLQDTTFDNLSILGCGPSTTERSLSFTSNANYIYFNNPHIEDFDYALGCSGAVDKPWEVHWSGGHIEAGDYDGALGPEFDHDYTSSPFEFDGCYRWYFTETTIVPVSVQRLISVNGGGTSDHPYFMRGLGTNRIIGDKIRWICPRDVGGIDAMQLTGDNSGNSFTDCHVEGAQGAKYSINMESGSWDCGSMTFLSVAEVKMFGFNINRGFIDKVRFGSNDGSVKTSGYLINSSVDAGLTSGEHLYELSTPPYRWLNQFVVSTDQRVSDYTNIVNGATIDMELVRPDVAFYNGTSGATVPNIVNCQRSRLLRFRNDTSGNLTINSTASVKPNTANPMVIGPFSVNYLRADHTGVMYQG